MSEGQVNDVLLIGDSTAGLLRNCSTLRPSKDMPLSLITKPTF